MYGGKITKFLFVILFLLLTCVAASPLPRDNEGSNDGCPPTKRIKLDDDEVKQMAQILRNAEFKTDMEPSDEQWQKVDSTLQSFFYENQIKSASQIDFQNNRKAYTVLMYELSSGLGLLPVNRLTTASVEDKLRDMLIDGDIKPVPDCPTTNLKEEGHFEYNAEAQQIFDAAIQLQEAEVIECQKYDDVIEESIEVVETAVVKAGKITLPCIEGEIDLSLIKPPSGKVFQKFSMRPELKQFLKSPFDLFKDFTNAFDNVVKKRQDDDDFDGKIYFLMSGNAKESKTMEELLDRMIYVGRGVNERELHQLLNAFLIKNHLKELLDQNSITYPRESKIIESWANNGPVIVATLDLNSFELMRTLESIAITTLGTEKLTNIMRGDIHLIQREKYVKDEVEMGKSGSILFQLLFERVTGCENAMLSDDFEKDFGTFKIREIKEADIRLPSKLMYSPKYTKELWAKIDLAKLSSIDRNVYEKLLYTSEQFLRTTLHVKINLHKTIKDSTWLVEKVKQRIFEFKGKLTGGSPILSQMYDSGLLSGNQSPGGVTLSRLLQVLNLNSGTLKEYNFWRKASNKFMPTAVDKKTLRPIIHQVNIRNFVNWRNNAYLKIGIVLENIPDRNALLPFEQLGPVEDVSKFVEKQHQTGGSPLLGAMFDNGDLNGYTPKINLVAQDALNELELNEGTFYELRFWKETVGTNVQVNSAERSRRKFIHEANSRNFVHWRNGAYIEHGFALENIPDREKLLHFEQLGPVEDVLTYANKQHKTGRSPLLEAMFDNGDLNDYTPKLSLVAQDALNELELNEGTFYELRFWKETVGTNVQVSQGNVDLIHEANARNFVNWRNGAYIEHEFALENIPDREKLLHYEQLGPVPDVMHFVNKQSKTKGSILLGEYYENGQLDEYKPPKIFPTPDTFNNLNPSDGTKAEWVYWAKTVGSFESVTGKKGQAKLDIVNRNIRNFVAWRNNAYAEIEFAVEDVPDRQNFIAYE